MVSESRTKTVRQLGHSTNTTDYSSFSTERQDSLIRNVKVFPHIKSKPQRRHKTRMI